MDLGPEIVKSRSVADMTLIAAFTIFREVPPLTLEGVTIALLYSVRPEPVRTYISLVEIVVSSANIS